MPMNQAVRFGLYRCRWFVFDSKGKPHQTPDTPPCYYMIFFGIYTFTKAHGNDRGGCVWLNHVNHVTYSSWTALTCDWCDCPVNNRCTTQQPRILGHSFVFDLGDTKKRGPPTPRHVKESCGASGLRIPLALI